LLIQRFVKVATDVQIRKFFNKKKKKKQGNKTVGCPKCIGTLGVVPDANG
jgi:hypothetical protein